MNYRLELTQTPGNNQVWAIKGLESWGHLSEGEKQTPDFYLWMAGMDEACDNAESIIRGLHGALYGLMQTDERLQEGDSFACAPCVANKFLSYSSDLGIIEIPALCFECKGVHVVRS